MGSKKLKAIAAHGTLITKVADPDRLRSYALKIAKNVRDYPSSYTLWGTGGADLTSWVEQGNLPTRNFRDGNFPSPKRISSRYWKEHGELIGMEGCYARPIRCKKVVKISEPWEVDPRYGGPEYETEAALGSDCGIEDEKAIFKGSELCNKYSLDVIEKVRELYVGWLRDIPSGYLRQVAEHVERNYDSERDFLARIYMILGEHGMSLDVEDVFKVFESVVFDPNADIRYELEEAFVSIKWIDISTAEMSFHVMAHGDRGIQEAVESVTNITDDFDGWYFEVDGEWRHPHVYVTVSWYKEY